jgi:ribosome biogenesis GTPase
MQPIAKEITKLGFDPDDLNAVDRTGFEDLVLNRVVAVHKERYVISDGHKDVFAELIGKLRYSAASALQYPTVGDWVWAQTYDTDTFAIIHAVLPRKTLLKRKTVGKKIDYQLIAANIDVAFIIQSLDENFSLRRLERYLVMINESDIKPFVLLSKSDLVSNATIAGSVNTIKARMPHLTVLPYSSKDGSDLERIRAHLKAGNTFCLLGSSGVGKTTLLNHLIGAPILKTKAVRAKDNKGRHATTHRHLVMIEGGAMLIDTPGMRELGTLGAEAGIDETFAEITELAQNCMFNDCSHTTEDGCAILVGLEDGLISAERLQNYLKMVKESRYNQMSYVEKRRKAKQFGKHCKSVMKHKRKRMRF